MSIDCSHVVSRMEENDEQEEQVLMFITASEKTAHEYDHLTEGIINIFKERRDYLRKLIKEQQ